MRDHEAHRREHLVGDRGTQRVVEHRLDLLVGPEVAHVVHDACDLPPLSVVASTHPLTHRVPVEEVPRGTFVDPDVER
jgi:hypothetical protein